jgi:hypothetical protein
MYLPSLCLLVYVVNREIESEQEARYREATGNCADPFNLRKPLKAPPVLP